MIIYKISVLLFIHGTGTTVEGIGARREDLSREYASLIGTRSVRPACKVVFLIKFYSKFKLNITLTDFVVISYYEFLYLRQR